MKRCIWWSVNHVINTLKIDYLKNKIDLEVSRDVMKFYSLLIFINVCMSDMPQGVPSHLYF